MSFENLVALLLVVTVVGVAYFRTHNDPASRTRLLSRSAFGLIAFETIFFAVFLIGQLVDNPGGLAAAGWISAWFVPLVGLGVLAWLDPPYTVRIFTALTVAVLGVMVWATVDTASWRGFENAHGPIRTVVVFVLAAGIAASGLRHPREAGWLLIALSLAPPILAALGRRLALGSLSVVVTPVLIAGILYLGSAHYLARTDRTTGPPNLGRHRLGVR